MAATSTAEQLLAAVREIEPIIRRHAPDAERDHRLARPVVDAMRDAGLFRLWRPAAFGGHEADPTTGARVVEEVSRIDSAAGWNLMISLSTEFSGAWFSEEGAADTFGDPNTIMGGSFNPPRRATPVDGGLRVTGRTPFASGIHQATWVTGLAQVADGDDVRLGPDGEPVTVLTLVPATEVAIVENWNTLGMRGTGSHDAVMTDVFVPAHRAVLWVPLEKASPVYAGPLYRLTLWPAVALLAVPALGVARAAIDALVELATVKTPAFTKRPLRDRSVVAAQLARAEAVSGAARAYLHRTLDEVYAVAVAGRPITMVHKVAVQLAATNTVLAAAEAVDLVHAAVGASGIREEQPFERHFRDAHVLTQHAFVCASRYEDAGRSMMGGDPEWGFFAF